MASLISTTTVLRDYPQPQPHYKSPTRFLLQPSSIGKLDQSPISSFPAPGSVRKLAANIREQAAANASVNAIVPKNKRGVETPNEMVQLITLRLQPLEHKRSSTSIGRMESSITSNSTPQVQQHQKTKPCSVATWSVLPSTSEEWKIIMEEIKSLFVERQYRRCSMRSKALLENITDSSQVNSLYITYLQFYAAISLEQTARSLHHNTSTKLPLFEESLSYYQKAASSVSSASFNASPKLLRLTERTVSSRRTSKSSISSSNRSSIDSIFSQTSDCGLSDSSRPASPQDVKYCSLDRCHKRNISSLDTAFRPTSLRLSKRVSFAQNLYTLMTETEPRPLNPTTKNADDLSLIDCFPLPPTPSLSRRTSSTSILSPRTEPETTSQSPFSTDDVSNFPIARYENNLTSFSNQLEYHIDSIYKQIDDVNSYNSVSTSTKRSSSSSSFFQLSRGCGEGDDNGTKDIASTFSGIDGVNKEELRKVDLRERIERLKANGWQRTRKFDASRYQMLCERALGELEGY